LGEGLGKRENPMFLPPEEGHFLRVVEISNGVEKEGRSILQGLGDGACIKKGKKVHKNYSLKGKGGGVWGLPS